MVEVDKEPLFLKSLQNYELALIAEDKLYYATSISRYYYALLLKAKLIVKSKNPQYNLNTKSSHDDIFTNLITTGVSNSGYGMFLDDNDKNTLRKCKVFKELRREAEYDNIDVDKEKFTEDFLKLYQKVYCIVERIISLIKSGKDEVSES
jgi:hypothetical protein